MVKECRNERLLVCRPVTGKPSGSRTSSPWTKIVHLRDPRPPNEHSLTILMIGVFDSIQKKDFGVDNVEAIPILG